jgi:hypothetical protein
MSRYHEDGRAKPVALIAPVIDTASFEAPWSLAEEFTSMIVSNVGRSGKIFVIPKEEENFAENPFGADITWMKREFPNQEFVVFTELVEHSLVPANKGKKETPNQDLSSNLNLALRLRIVDLRGSSPHVVLQEILKDSYFIPKTLLPVDYNTLVWGHPEFSKTAIGIAHSQIAKEAAARISDYIMLAKSR